MNFFLMGALLLSIGPQVAFAEETWSEKAGNKSNAVKRELKKAGHRVSEHACSDGDAKCTGKKLKNRAVETKDATVDGAKELEDKVD